MGEESREYTVTLKADDITYNRIREYVELEDMTDYILEEDREEVNKYIEKLQHRIREQKYEISHYRGELEAWEKMWRIWNQTDSNG